MAFQVTQCPRCESTFNTDPRLLELAGGKVRCGACLTVFQADENFLMEDATDSSEHESVFVGHTPEDFFDPAVFLTRSALQEHTDIQAPDTQAPHFPSLDTSPPEDSPTPEPPTPPPEPIPAPAPEATQETITGATAEAQFTSPDAMAPDAEDAQAIESSHLEFFAAVNESLDDVQEFDGIEDLQTIAELNAMDKPNTDMFTTSWGQSTTDEEPSEDEIEAVLAGELDDDIDAEPSTDAGATDEVEESQPVELNTIRKEATHRPEEISLSVSFAVEPRRREVTEPPRTPNEEPQRDPNEEHQRDPNKEPQRDLNEELQRELNEESQQDSTEEPQQRTEEPPQADHGEDAQAVFDAETQPAIEEEPQSGPGPQQTLQEAPGADAWTAPVRDSDTQGTPDSDDLPHTETAIPDDDEPLAAEFNAAIAEDEFAESVEIGPESGAGEAAIDLEIGELEAAEAVDTRPESTDGPTDADAIGDHLWSAPVGAESLEEELAATEEDIDTSTEAIRARARQAQYQDEDTLEAIPREHLQALGTMTPPVELIAGMPRSWGRNIVLSILCLILGATLAGQYAWREIDRYAQEPLARTVFQWLCTEIGCTLPAYSNIDAIVSSNLTVRSHPERQDALIVAVEMRNTAQFPQAFPVMVLSFNSAGNQLLALREFFPEEYLDPGLRDVTLMPVMSPVQVSIEIIDPGGDAVNYTMAFRLP